LREDVDDFEAATDTLEDTVENLTADSDGATWAESAIQRASLDLLARDLQYELDELRSWPGETGGDPDWDLVAERISALDDRVADVAVVLERASRPAWRDHHGASVDTVEQLLSGRELPVDWATVQSEIEDHRPTTLAD
jgi:hypothetical protein